ncbi:PTS system mannose/fructose/sorbose family transporter subunit IID [Enterocloster lavalensis]|uniref:PTS system mannose/fructose/sorbose family transporter subunit IID n=1 Tax=Enterocloster lavalensis TaxID=460384 RepID=UPI0023F15B6E|nr:PTS system mannose/fructose/sorbose family transporter subunit IID [Enterocloster lavalensis]
MSFMMALLLAVVMGLLLTENLGYGHIQISRPVFAGPIIGLLMGDLETGLIVGGTVEMMFMGVFPVGGSVPPNAQFAGMMSTVLAIASGGNPEVGIALAYPIGVFAQFVLLLDYNVNLLIIHRADRQIMGGKASAVNQNLMLCLLCMFSCWVLSSFLGIYLGSTWVESFYAGLPEWLRQGLSVAGGIMPAMGMAMLLKMMDFRKFWAFLMVGYVLTAYLNMNILSIAILSTGVAVAVYMLGNSGDKQQSGGDEKAAKAARVLDKKDLANMNLRSMFVGACLNYERYLGLGFSYAMYPVLKKLYKGDELNAAVLRHTEFYNTHPWMHNLILGVTAALEEQRSLGNPISEDAISATKAGLMGPTAGFGDSFFKGVVVTITGAFAAGLAIDGNPIAPVVFIIPNLVVCFLVRYYGTKLGYEYGTKLIVKMRKTNIIQKFVDGSTIVGMMVTAGLITNYVKVNLATVFNMSGKELVLNDLINSVLPKVLPYSVVFIYYYILKKNARYGIYITLICSFALGIAGAYFKVL